MLVKMTKLKVPEIPENPKPENPEKPSVCAASFDYTKGPDLQGWLNDNEDQQAQPENLEIPEIVVSEPINSKPSKTKKWWFEFNRYSLKRFNGWFSNYYGLPAPLRSLDLDGYGDKGQRASDQLLDRLCDIGIFGKLIGRINGLTKGSEKWDDIFDLVEDMLKDTYDEIQEKKGTKK